MDVLKIYFVFSVIYIYSYIGDFYVLLSKSLFAIVDMQLKGDHLNKTPDNCDSL